jgi:hypothetical protein
MKNYNGHNLRSCGDYGLTGDKERRFTPKPSDFNYTEKNNTVTDEEIEQHSIYGYLSYQSSDSINSDDTSTKTISADNGTDDADNEAIVNTGHTAEHVMKEV